MHCLPPVVASHARHRKAMLRNILKDFLRKRQKRQKHVSRVVSDAHGFDCTFGGHGQSVVVRMGGGPKLLELLFQTWVGTRGGVKRAAFF